MTAEGLGKVGSGTLSSSGARRLELLAGRGRDCDRQSDRTDRRWRDEDVGEVSGSNTLEGRAKATADAIAEQLRIRFRARGWKK